jgi:hypothetical protein
MITLKDIQRRVEKEISKYLEFDIKEIFEQSDYITIYGGAVRDSIAGMDIHDIDILCMPDSASKLRNFIRTRGYEPLDLYDIDTLSMYHGISLISEPWTFMNKNKKIIQIIRPRWIGQRSIEKNYQEAYYDLIKNVDISCCGVFIENQSRDITLKEACKDAIINCLSRTYEVNTWSKLYNTNRVIMREHKLSIRGWLCLNEIISDNKKLLKKQRLIKILKLEFKPEYDYRIWTDEEYTYRPKKIEKEISFI